APDGALLGHACNNRAVFGRGRVDEVNRRGLVGQQVVQRNQDRGHHLVGVKRRNDPSAYLVQHGHVVQVALELIQLASPSEIVRAHSEATVLLNPGRKSGASVSSASLVPGKKRAHVQATSGSASGGRA